jgi:hypothetical protein
MGISWVLLQSKERMEFVFDGLLISVALSILLGRSRAHEVNEALRR